MDDGFSTGVVTGILVAAIAALLFFTARKISDHQVEDQVLLQQLKQCRATCGADL